MRIGIAHHLGWAVAVTATVRHEVVDRRRIELLADDLPNAILHGPRARPGPPWTTDHRTALAATVIGSR